MYRLTFASSQRQTIIAIDAMITLLTAHACLTITLTCVGTATTIQTATRVATARCASYASLQMPKTISTLIASTTNDIWQTPALARFSIARIVHRTGWITMAFWKKKYEFVCSSIIKKNDLAGIGTIQMNCIAIACRFVLFFGITIDRIVVQ